MSNFTFSFDSFAIGNTRAVHNDTDYVAAALHVNGGIAFGDAFRVGNVNNGTHPIAISGGETPIGPDDQVVFTYLVVNHGGGNPQQVTDACLNALIQTALNEFDPAGAIPVQTEHGMLPASIAEGLKTASDINLLWNIAKTAFQGISSDRCDGPVIIDRISMTGSQVAQLAPISQKESLSIVYEGTNSALFCGSNSRYSAQWSIAQPEALRRQPRPVAFIGK